MTPTRGLLITIEGVDGTGKTTLATGLVQALQADEIDAAMLREPGGVQLSERIRTLVKDPALTVGDRAEALLYAAARAQLVEQAVEPALRDGRWLILDRFIDSSLAYQGAGRGLGIDAIRELNAFGTGGLTPDHTLLLKLDPVAARARTGTRGETPDRLELEGNSFFATIAAAYEHLAASEPQRFTVLDASRAPAAVLADALTALAPLRER